jgi:hypothetical protein
MPFMTNCPDCSARISAPDDARGRAARCPSCGVEFTLPTLRATRPESEPDDLPRFESPHTGPEAMRARRGGGSLIAVILALLALAVAVTALVLVFVRAPSKEDLSRPDRLPGTDLSNYDLKSPKEAMISMERMNLNRDMRAHYQLALKLKDKRAQERLDTLEVKAEQDFKGDRILFISFKEKGVVKHETEAYEKDPDTGIWFFKHLSHYVVEKDNKDLAKKMREWEESGEKQKDLPEIP